MAEVKNIKRMIVDFDKLVWKPFNLGYRVEAVMQAQKLATSSGHILLEYIIKKDFCLNFDGKDGATVISSGKLQRIIKYFSDNRLWDLLYECKIIDNNTYDSLKKITRLRNTHAHDFWAIFEDEKKIKTALKKMESNYKTLSNLVINFK